MLFNKNAMSILIELCSGYNERIYGRAVARKLKINQKTASNILNKMEKENILKFNREGKNKYYYLNKFNQNIREIIKLAEIEKKIRFIHKHKTLGELFAKLEEKTFGILVIFGSYAKGTNHENSDLDVFVVGNISDINELEELYHRKINIIKIKKESFNKEEHIIKEIAKNHIVLKGVEGFIDLVWSA